MAENEEGLKRKKNSFAIVASSLVPSIPTFLSPFLPSPGLYGVGRGGGGGVLITYEAVVLLDKVVVLLSGGNVVNRSSRHG